uniref:Uncharacterized protein n=1 Tax=Anopheles atroparvus TaxID=41427 RepID=A0A182J8C5_ANOAO
MVQLKHRLYILVYLLCIWCQAAHPQPVEQRMVAAGRDEATEPIPAIYNIPPQSPVKILREPSPITEQDSMNGVPDDMQQSESYTYSYYRPLYYPGVYYSYYPRYRWYRPYYYYNNWWYY